MATSKPFTSYPLPTPLRSSLFKSTNDGAVPPIEELEALQAELKNLKTRTLEKARRAGEDMKVLDEGMKRMKEKAKKGKEREVKEKVKRERDFSVTPMPDSADDSKPLASTLSSSSMGSTKQRMSSHPLNSNSGAPSSSRSSVDPEKKKKKKRKRDMLEDSDIEMAETAPRIHKGSTPISTHSISVPPAPKAAKSISSSSVSKNSSQSHTGIDFTVPISLQVLPPRPPIQPPPVPAPSHPTLVTEDFSKIGKAPPQVAVATFYSSVEPYLKNIKEEDIGFLEWTGDDIEPFVIPKLGRHYLEVWEEQDRLNEPATSATHATLQSAACLESEPPPNPYAVAPNPSFDPSTLAESDTQTEHLGHGPLTERLISSLLPMPESHSTWKGVKAAEDAMEGRPGGSGAAASRKEKLTVADLERRIGDTMRWHGLLPSASGHVGSQQIDYSGKTDDPISSALRINQAELRRVSAANRLRRARYAEIAKDRVGWAEYLELRDTIDKNILNVYTKLQRLQKTQKEAPKLGRKKKIKPEDGVSVNGLNGSNNASSEPPPLPPCPAALGLGPDEDNRLVVSDTLKQLVQTRRNWVKLGEALLDEKEGPLDSMDVDDDDDDDVGDGSGLNINGSSTSNWRVDSRERPRRGRLIGFPKESIFKGIEEEVDKIMRQWERSEAERERADMQNQMKPATMTVTTTTSAANTNLNSTPTPTTTTSNSNVTTLSAGSGLKIHLNGNVQSTYGKGKGKARDDQMDVG
ncbi:hypothetical protein GYMLUDRAFT_233775 [Collybiopsis luxurians FD-317 M1]|uniref:Transcriptional adapter 3 n=1 Tax=Collybiopsis luxurians FD-317 M1 TaxID=944289 RepID=A0A0D0BCD9_9AGAR|nr:hypothetical protein GYMLUDRAFT_233775 [Collybiopsis luxurians FD-317 M1]